MPGLNLFTGFRNYQLVNESGEPYLEETNGVLQALFPSHGPESDVVVADSDQRRTHNPDEADIGCPITQNLLSSIGDDKWIHPG